jgi:hypothetical protein
LTAIIGSLPTLRHQGTNSSTPTWFVSTERQARSSRLGRSAAGAYDYNSYVCDILEQYTSIY